MGAQYSKTRHNVGLLCLDYLVEKHRAGPYKMKVRDSSILFGELLTFLKVSFASNIAEMSVISATHKLNILLLSPFSYMNIIGKNVAKAMKAEKIDKTSLIVLHDDLEQKLGRIRLVKGTSFK